MRFKLAAAGIGALALALGLFMWTRVPRTNSAPINASSTDDDFDHAESLTMAIDYMGYAPSTLIGNHWRGKACREITYLLDAGGRKLFFFTRDKESGKITGAVTRDQINEMLHQHISFEGSFGNSTINFSKSGEVHYIGQVPDKERADVYIRLNKEACGAQVDRVVYRGFERTNVVDVKIQLMPGR